MKRAVWVMPLLVSMWAMPAHAVRPSYSFLDAAYAHSEAKDNEEIQAQGPRVALNISLSRAFYFAGEYDQQHFDNSNNKVTASSFGFGLHSLNSKFQTFMAGSYERLDFNDDDVERDAKDEGYGVQLGFRLPAGVLELNADVKYLQVGPSGEDSDEWRYRGMVQSRLTRNIAAVFGYEVFEEARVEQITAGLRMYFNTGHDQPRRKKKSARPTNQSQ